MKDFLRRSKDDEKKRKGVAKICSEFLDKMKMPKKYQWKDGSLPL